MPSRGLSRSSERIPSSVHRIFRLNHSWAANQRWSLGRRRSRPGEAARGLRPAPRTPRTRQRRHRCHRHEADEAALHRVAKLGERPPIEPRSTCRHKPAATGPKRLWRSAGWIRRSSPAPPRGERRFASSFPDRRVRGPCQRTRPVLESGRLSRLRNSTGDSCSVPGKSSASACSRSSTAPRASRSRNVHSARVSAHAVRRSCRSLREFGEAWGSKDCLSGVVVSPRPPSVLDPRAESELRRRWHRAAAKIPEPGKPWPRLSIRRGCAPRARY
jgi:hypothetical protein